MTLYDLDLPSFGQHILRRHLKVTSSFRKGLYRTALDATSRKHRNTQALQSVKLTILSIMNVKLAKRMVLIKYEKPRVAPITVPARLMVCRPSNALC